MPKEIIKITFYICQIKSRLFQIILELKQPPCPLVLLANLRCPINLSHLNDLVNRKRGTAEGWGTRNNQPTLWG